MKNNKDLKSYPKMKNGKKKNNGAVGTDVNLIAVGTVADLGVAVAQALSDAPAAVLDIFSNA